MIHIYFADADFLVKPERALKILAHMEKLLAKRVIKPEVTFELSVGSLRKSSWEAIQALARMPGHFFTFAIQTVNPRALALLGRHRPAPDVYVAKAALLKEAIPNVDIYADIMFPLPGDDLAGVKDTLEFAFSLRLNKI
ncbi:MAG: hypothetical protein H7832_02570 [Magnetococcus sp. DMHC-6]